MALDFRVTLSNIDGAFTQYERDLEDGLIEGTDDALEDTVEALRSATPLDTGRARAGWYYRRIPGTNRFELANDVEYIDELNDGTSRQAPARFIEGTILGSGFFSPIGGVIDRRS